MTALAIGLATPDMWQTGLVVQDPWFLAPPADFPASEYRLDIVLFDAYTRSELARTELQTMLSVSNLWIRSVTGDKILA
jgi:hypothetical protein